MKKYTHPYSHQVTTINTDGSTHSIYSTLRKKIYKLDVDSRSHKVWSEANKTVFIEKGQLLKFKKRFNVR